MQIKTIIMGAAGRDFHNFNAYFRDNKEYEVVAFTATQIPGIEKRMYPPELAGPNYPEGVPIYPEETLPELIRKHNVDQVVFSYSDVSHEYVMHRASIALASGADFRLLSPSATMLKAKVPVVSVCAVRTGSGKSQTSRTVCRILKKLGYKVVVVRHPMPYGDLRKQVCQRFESMKDLDRYDCTIEEREDYEPHIANGFVVYAGVDYEKILREAEKEADIIVWDGGNNDVPFYMSDLHIVVADPHRPGHELIYHPGETNLRMANIVVINKVDTADPDNIEVVRKNIKAANPGATIVKTASPITVDDPELIRGKKVLVVDPRPYAVGSIKDVFEKYSHMNALLPAVGYGKEQIRELEETINATPCDAVVIGTPIDLRQALRLNKPAVRVRYELQEVGKPNLDGVLRNRFPKR